MLGRRRFLLESLGAAAALSGVARKAAAVTAAPSRLSFYHIHTGEKLTITYREHGQVVPDALAEINRYLRDFRTEQIHVIDVALLDKLDALYTAFEGRAIDVRLTSAKTSSLRDAALAMKSGGVGYYAESNFVHIDTGKTRAW